jgi:curved DNA-binding protein CbpA
MAHSPRPPLGGLQVNSWFAVSPPSLRSPAKPRAANANSCCVTPSHGQSSSACSSSPSPAQACSKSTAAQAVRPASGASPGTNQHENDEFVPLDTARLADHYAQLGVGRDAGVDHIKSAYRRLALLHHPDRAGAAVTTCGHHDASNASSLHSSNSSGTSTIENIDDIDDDDDDDGSGIQGDFGNIDDIDDDDADENRGEHDVRIEGVDVVGCGARLDEGAAGATAPAAEVDVTELMGGQEEEARAAAEAKAYHVAMFSLVYNAYKVLSDPVERRQYDLEQGFAEKSQANLSALHHEQRQQAEKEIELMNVTYATCCNAEENVRGVIITSARYGALAKYVNSRKPIERAATGKTIDVKLQLQCMVESSALYLEGGVSKVISCRGLFNPSDHPEAGSEPHLCVRYSFRGAQHQVVVSDRQELKIPLRGHQLSAGQQEPQSRNKSSKKRSRRTKGHRHHHRTPSRRRSSKLSQERDVSSSNMHAPTAQHAGAAQGPSASKKTPFASASSPASSSSTPPSTMATSRQAMMFSLGALAAALALLFVARSKTRA